MFKVGIGYDVHRLGPDRKLILGGVEIPYELGLIGHSDADVLIHAIIDAILGALGKPDIGSFFPDTDIKYKNISSMLLLKKIACIPKENGAKISNIDSIVITEQPKLINHIKQMRTNIAEMLEIKPEYVNIKATTHERIGSLGRGEGIAAQAVTLISMPE